MKVHFIRLFIFISIWGIFPNAYAQDSLSCNNVYLEMGGPGGASLNYERILFQKRNRSFGLRMGISGFLYRNHNYPLLGKKWYPSYGLVSGIFYLISSKNREHHLDLGLNYNHQKIERLLDYAQISNGVVIEDSTFNALGENITVGLKIGYRRQKPDKGFFYKAGIVPIWVILNNPLHIPGTKKFSINSNSTFFLPFLELGFGYTF